MILPDFIYLDTDRVQNFVSVIQSGLADEFTVSKRETTELGGSGKIGVPKLFGESDIGLGGDAKKVSEQEEKVTRRTTDFYYFNVLYSYLKREANLDTHTTWTSRTRSKLRVGEFIELHGELLVPPFERLMEALSAIPQIFETWKPLIESTQPSTSRQSGAKRKRKRQHKPVTKPRSELDVIVDQINSLMSVLNTARGELRFLPMRPLEEKEDTFQFWASLAPQFLTSTLDDLPAECTLVGRISRLLRKDEKERILNLLPKGMVVPEEMLIGVVEALASVPFLAVSISMDDLYISYPDVFIVPIAIFR